MVIMKTVEGRLEVKAADDTMYIDDGTDKFGESLFFESGDVPKSDKDFIIEEVRQIKVIQLLIMERLHSIAEKLDRI